MNKHESRANTANDPGESLNIFQSINCTSDQMLLFKSPSNDKYGSVKVDKDTHSHINTLEHPSDDKIDQTRCYIQ